MKFSDYLMTFFILLIFTILYVIGLVLSRIKEIQDNWPNYRCDQGIMIFADFFGYDAMENFGYCIAETQKNMMSQYMKPLYYSMNLAGNLGGNLIGQLQSMRELLSSSAFDMGGFTSSMTGGIRGIKDKVQSQFGSINVLFNQGNAAADVLDKAGKEIPKVINTVIQKADDALP